LTGGEKGDPDSQNGTCSTIRAPFRTEAKTESTEKKGNRSQVHGSTFRVKDKEDIEDPKSSSKMLIFPSNCQFGSKFWIRPDDDDAFLLNTHSKWSPGRRMEP
jgi:hypothetical protein